MSPYRMCPVGLVLPRQQGTASLILVRQQRNRATHSQHGPDLHYVVTRLHPADFLSFLFLPSCRRSLLSIFKSLETGSVDQAPNKFTRMTVAYTISISP